MRSIRRYLARTLALVLAVTALLTVTAAYLITDHELEEILDAQLSLQGRIIAGLVSPTTTREEYRRIARRLSLPGHEARAYADGQLEPSSPQAPPAALYHEEERVLSIGFWNADGSPRLLGARWNGDTPFPAPGEEGYRWVDYAGDRWRVFSLFDAPSATWVQVGVRGDFLEEIVERVALNNLWPMLLLLPLLLWLMVRIIRRGLSPIALLSRQVQGRDGCDLTPIELTVPQELGGLHQALNDFIARLGKTLERERRFTADAAHELRTPLAALKIHLDNAQAGEGQSLQKAAIGVERLQRVVEQLLVLARLDRASTVQAETLDIYPIVVELTAELWPLAHARRQELLVMGETRLEVQADPVEAGILLRNLLDNALRYTPEGGCIEVELCRRQDRPQVIVRDNGPGIPEELLDKVTERFRRASDQRTTGSGLGLSIVVELARRQHAELRLKNRAPQGLEASLLWPTP
ncbi:two-component system, OmpR family, sensor histidine kinase QseC [Modicisalibacter ilicicola DSM 19980]|uniref:histidine kinase n=1 Tax=Modicisalibacter ilicicola DSM 19980 TaxID=1121942 RepID=A0A1M5DNR0_9GAMM|nr:ATP-binding protein [Halomonas ilicicola]SHF68600.1 two-component system, OmpR family, sensor histidine kinase QseC [Halomonas ilicicola DSM 19980]